jgi:hypothetical protein
MLNGCVDLLNRCEDEAGGGADEGELGGGQHQL